jgi:hypothetical protein
MTKLTYEMLNDLFHSIYYFGYDNKKAQDLREATGWKKFFITVCEQILNIILKLMLIILQ